MKKNAMLKIAAVLLVAVLLTTCAISSTFAKYVTAADDFSESARVAAWGITFDPKMSDTDKHLFDKVYIETEGTVGYVGVNSKLMAPGTSGAIYFGNEVTGKPEVSAVVKYVADCSITKTNSQSSASAADFLSRINFQYRVGDGNWTPCTDLDVLETAINAEIEIDPNTSAASASKPIGFKWNWEFEDPDSETDAADGLKVYDKQDVVFADAGFVLSLNYTIDIYQTGGAGAADGLDSN